MGPLFRVAIRIPQTGTGEELAAELVDLGKGSAQELQWILIPPIAFLCVTLTLSGVSPPTITPSQIDCGN
jgi:hypothetical protein